MRACCNGVTNNLIAIVCGVRVDGMRTERPRQCSCCAELVLLGGWVLACAGRRARGASDAAPCDEARSEASREESSFRRHELDVQARLYLRSSRLLIRRGLAKILTRGEEYKPTRGSGEGSASRSVRCERPIGEILHYRTVKVECRDESWGAGSATVGNIYRQDKDPGDDEINMCEDDEDRRR